MPETDEITCECVEKCCTHHLLPDRCGRELRTEEERRDVEFGRQLNSPDYPAICDRCRLAKNAEVGGHLKPEGGKHPSRRN